MSGQNWCIIPVFLIILQQTSTNFGKTLLPAHACLLPYPRWPPDFSWSSTGRLRNYHCVQILEPSDPFTWRDNYFCSSDSKRNPNMTWSSRNPIPGMKCTHITEPADPRPTWHDNYLCLPSNSTLNFQWSYQGPIANKSCIQWLETSGPKSWNDNYLCGEDENPALRERNQTGCGQQEDFFYGQNVKQSIAKSNKTKLSGFCLNCTTNTTFKVQYTNDTLCSCDRIVNLGQPVFFECNKKLRLNFSVTISVRNISRQWGENCTFIFSFTGHGVTKTVPVTLTISTPYIINTDFRSSTLSLVDQPSSTSSFMVANSTYTTWKMSSTVVKPQPSQSVVPVHTEIVITPSVEESLTSEPLLMTSSPTKSVFLVTSIKAAIASKLLPSSTWSPDTEKLKKLKNDIEFINNVNTSAVKISDRKTIDRVLDAAANLINTNLTTEYQKEDPGMLAVEVLQDLGHSISRQLDLGNNKSVTFEKVTEDLVLSAAVINTTISPGFTFPTDDIKMTSGEKIDIPRSVFASEKSYFVGIIFEAYGEMRNNTGDLILGTKVINAVVSPRPSDELKEPVNMTFEKNIWVDLTLAGDCSFWIENNTLSGEHGRWSTRQCFKTFENESHINCSCHHFTNFAVLLKVSDEEQSSVVVNPQPSQSVVPVHTGIIITPSIEESLVSQQLLMTSSPTKSILSVTSIQASIASKLLPSSTWSPKNDLDLAILVLTQLQPLYKKSGENKFESFEMVKSEQRNRNLQGNITS